jgi:hypothetical protein
VTHASVEFVLLQLGYLQLYLHPLQITIQQWPTTVSKGKSSIEGKNSGEVTPASPEARPVKKGRPVVGRRLHPLPQKIKKGKKGGAEVDQGLHRHTTKRKQREKQWRSDACITLHKIYRREEQW